MKLPVEKPLALHDLAIKELNSELERGLADIDSNHLYSAEAIWINLKERVAT